MKIKEFENKFIKINDVICYISDIYPDINQPEKFIIYSSTFINTISNYEKIDFRNRFRYSLVENDLKECELFNFKGTIYWFGEDYNCLGIDDSNEYIYQSPRETSAFSDFFCIKFHEKINEKKHISIYIEIENGVLKKEEIIESSENIENKIIDFISYKFDLNKSKNIFLNYKSFNNNFNIEVEKKIKEIFKLEIFLESGKDASKRINDVIEIIKFNIKKSDFVNALRSLRILRNSIIDFIYDDYFIPISWKLESLLKHLEFKKEYKESYLDKSSEEEIEIEIKKHIDKIYIDSNKHIVLAENLVNERKKYYDIPIYFQLTKFEDLDIKNFEFKKPDNRIIKFIENKILSNEEWKLWNLCSGITNNAIHKNNYDFENFEGWWIYKNEIEMVIKIIEIFLNTLIKYNEYKMLDK